MRSVSKTQRKNVTAELAEAISSFNITGVRKLLSDEGSFAVQDENLKIVILGKEEFIRWLGGCYSKFLFRGRLKRSLNFTIVQCMQCVNGNPIIVIDEGRFPVFSGNQTKYEQSGLVIKSNDHKVTGIEFCFLVMKTEHPFIYEKRCLKPEL